MTKKILMGTARTMAIMVVMMMICLSVSDNIIFAKESQNAIPYEHSLEDISSSCVEELEGLAEKYFHTESEYDLADPHFEVVNINACKTNVVFDTNGESEYIDLIVETEEGFYANVSEFAEWSSQNIAVASVYQGKIYARGAGETHIQAVYGGFSIEIPVIVEHERNLLQLDMVNSRANKTAYQRALDIYNQTWSPNSDIYQWGTTKTYFKSGTTYAGYPYTQYGDCYPTSFLNGKIFLNVLNDSNFLKLTTRTSVEKNEVYCPYYGLDCSGLVCYALDTSKKYATSDMITNIGNGTFSKVGSYNTSSPSKNDLLESYELLESGDALVKSGHCFLVMTNNKSKQQVTVIEQTPPLTCVSTYSYSDLAQEKYRPFH